MITLWQLGGDNLSLIHVITYIIFLSNDFIRPTVL